MSDTKGKNKNAVPEDGEEKKAANGSDPMEEGGDSQLPQLNFATFIFSLNSSALVHLGMLEDPASGTKAANLPLAKQTIDILGMLEEKTRGNLTEDEGNMLKNILYDLRINYIKVKS